VAAAAGHRHDVFDGQLAFREMSAAVGADVAVADEQSVLGEADVRVADRDAVRPRIIGIELVMNSDRAPVDSWTPPAMPKRFSPSSVTTLPAA
jgi:hypothetical protein